MNFTEDPSITENPASKSIFNRLWKNRENISRGIGYGLDAAASYGLEYSQDNDYENAFRKRMQQDPVWDYQNMYGNNQPLIMAEEGAKVRTTGSPAMPVEIEGGEFMVLPDGTTEIGKGRKHSKGGIDTILPNGTSIFSAKLKPIGSKKSFAELAKKHDYSKELEILDNPYASDVARNTAEKMLPRKQKTLNELFKLQQSLNNNSSGEPVDGKEFAKGGKLKTRTMKYQKGGVYDVNDAELERLKSLGYKIEIM